MGYNEVAHLFCLSLSFFCTVRGKGVTPLVQGNCTALYTSGWVPSLELRSLYGSYAWHASPPPVILKKEGERQNLWGFCAGSSQRGQKQVVSRQCRRAQRGRLQCTPCLAHLHHYSIAMCACAPVLAQTPTHCTCLCLLAERRGEKREKKRCADKTTFFQLESVLKPFRYEVITAVPIPVVPIWRVAACVAEQVPSSEPTFARAFSSHLQLQSRWRFLFFLCAARVIPMTTSAQTDGRAERARARVCV